MTEVIAEAGVNHFGKLDVAKELADAALDARASVVKFQTYDVDQLIKKGDPEYQKLSELSLSHADFKKLAKHCEDIGIEFMSTPGDVDSLKFIVEELGVKRIKIGSDDLTNHKLLFAARKTMLPLILSTGMANFGEIWDALCVTSKHEITLLHCVSCYPCRLQDANLRAITNMKLWLRENQCEDVKVGYSDHTGEGETLLVAAALGASIIEAHIMLIGDGQPPVDHAVSFSSNYLGALINNIRDIEMILGHGRKEPCAGELEMIPKLRKNKDGMRAA